MFASVRFRVECEVITPSVITNWSKTAAPDVLMSESVPIIVLPLEVTYPAEAWLPQPYAVFQLDELFAKLAEVHTVE